MGRRKPKSFTKDKNAVVNTTSNKNVNNQYKASLFEQIFHEKGEALSLYNAINGTTYSDEEALTITTINGALYMDYRNDVSFLIDCSLNLYEHQSTWNPNMPLRGLGYFARLYEDYVRLNELNIYSETRLKLPKPQFFVFYNGTKDEPDRQILKLSDSFADDGLEPHLEVIAVVLNINYGHNRELMEGCRALHDYAMFIDVVRKHMNEGYITKRAVDMAVEECIANDILRDFLVRNKTGVMRMLFGPEDWERHKQREMKALTEETVKRVTEETVKRVTEETEKRVAEETEKRVAEETEKRVAEETEKRVAEETEKRVAEETEKRVAEETEKRVAEETEKRVAEETEKRVRKATEAKVAEEMELYIQNEVERRVLAIEILKCLEKYGEVSQMLSLKIHGQKDITTLKKWYELAESTDKIKTFEAQIETTV